MAYLHGNRWGHCGLLSNAPAFPDHPTAIAANPLAWSLPVTPPELPHRLTVADVCILRASLKPSARIPDTPGGGPIGAPYILWSESDSAYVLHAYGRTQAVSPQVQVLAACLRNERAEPGFIRRLLDASEPPDLATLDPHTALRERQHRAALHATAKENDWQREEAARERRRLTPPLATDISLDDLLSGP